MKLAVIMYVCQRFVVFYSFFFFISSLLCLWFLHANGSRMYNAFLMVRKCNRAVKPAQLYLCPKAHQMKLYSQCPKAEWRNFFSRTQNMSTCVDTDWPLSISASSEGHQCDGRQHNLRFNYGLKTVLQMRLLIFWDQKSHQLSKQEGDGWTPDTIEWHFQGVMLFYYSPHFTHAVALRRAQHFSKAQMGFKAQPVTRRTICLMLYEVRCDYIGCVSNTSPPTKGHKWK